MRKDLSVLITGVTGFVGSHLADYLSQQGYVVIGISRTLPHNKKFVGAHFYKVDLASERLDEIISEPIDVIIHAAAQSPYNVTSCQDYISSNLLGTHEVVRFAKKVQARLLIYCSAVSVYGEVMISEINEQTHIINPDVYGMTKYLGEKMCSDITSQVPSLIVRLPGIVGKHAHSSWIARMFHCSRSNNEAEIYNPESLFNNVIHIETVCDFMKMVIDRTDYGSDIILLGCTYPISVAEVVAILGVRYKVCQNGKKSFTLGLDKVAQQYHYKLLSTRECLEKYVDEEA